MNHFHHYLINSPLEQFEIHNSWNINIFGLEISFFNNLVIYFFIITSIILTFHYLALNNHHIIPSRFSIINETFYDTIHNMVKTQIGSRNEIFFPFIFSLFIFIIFANLLGNIPYSFAVTSHLVFTIALSTTIFFGVTILCFKIHGLKFFSLLCPSGTPLMLVPLLVLIETVSYIARAVSLGLRLGANIMAGHMLLVILAGFLFNIFTSGIIFFFIGLLPFSIFMGIGILELAISCIQSYVFVILTCSYLKDAIELH